MPVVVPVRRTDGVGRVRRGSVSGVVPVGRRLAQIRDEVLGPVLERARLAAALGSVVLDGEVRRGIAVDGSSRRGGRVRRGVALCGFVGGSH